VTVHDTVAELTGGRTGGQLLKPRTEASLRYAVRRRGRGYVPTVKRFEQYATEVVYRTALRRGIDNGYRDCDLGEITGFR